MNYLWACHDIDQFFVCIGILRHSHRIAGVETLTINCIDGNGHKVIESNDGSLDWHLTETKSLE